MIDLIINDDEHDANYVPQALDDRSLLYFVFFLSILVVFELPQEYRKYWYGWWDLREGR